MSLVKKHNSNLFPSIFDEFFKPDWLGGIQNETLKAPAVNIIESETNFVLELAAPGRKKEDFNIEINDNILTVSSEQKSETEEKDSKGKYTRREFSLNSFKRVFTLPETIDEDKINAVYNDGLLELTLPKKEEALPKPKRLIAIS